MAKKRKNRKGEEIVVNIKRLQVNYELRYEYLPILSEYIKNLPKEHREIRKDRIITSDGVEKDDWVRKVSNAKMGEIVIFMLDNNIQFYFENITQEILDQMAADYRARQLRLREILRLKSEELKEAEYEDYSFMKIQPYNYQKQAVKFFEINNGIAILGDQPGVGKTCAALAYAVKYNLKTLVICPAALKLMWRSEIEKFTYEKGFVYKFKPKKKSKLKAYKKSESLFHIINYDSIDKPYVKLEYNHKCKGKRVDKNMKSVSCGWESTDLTKKYAKCPICENTGTIKTRVVGVVYFEDKTSIEINPEDYDLIVLDECHRIKEEKTTWTKIIRMAFASIPRKILMSGTVIKNRPFELFPMLNFVDPNEWKNSHEFGVRYGAGHYTGFGWDYSGASHLEELFERMSGVFLRRLKKDVLEELPEKTRLDIPIEMTDKEHREYTKLEDEFKRDDNEDGYLAKMHKLKQFTGRVKIDRVKEIIEDIIDGGEKVVVVSDYQFMAEELKEYFDDIAVLHTGSMSDEDKHMSEVAFMEDEKIKVFAGMILASGVGITLTAASKIIILGFAWTPADMEQVEDRIHRASSTADKIEIIQLFCVDTVDEDAKDILAEKSYITTKVMDNKEFKREAQTCDENIFKELLKRVKSR